MDYSLKSLRDAFEDAQYKQARRGYELYAILLATSLDRRFVLEYLSFFHELDTLTGSRVLVIGPHLGRPLDSFYEDETRALRSSDLHNVQAVVGHNPSAVQQSTANPRAGQFLEFMQDQTRESYAITRYLRIPADSMPLLVLFDNLDAPHDLVQWSLGNTSGRDFVRELRSLLRTVSDECGWEVADRIKQLEDRAGTFHQTYWSSRDVPYLIRNEWEAWHRARTELAPLLDITNYLERVAELRRAFEAARADGALRIPLDSVGDTIAKLESGRLDRDSFSHLENHHRRWKSRMPSEYKAALARMSYPHRASLYIRDGRLTLQPEEAVSERSRLEEQCRQAESAFESKRTQFASEADASLAQTREDAARPKAPPLMVVRRLLGRAATTVGDPLPSVEFRTLMADAPAAVPRVFISYSHDSREHAARVLELAQKLRADCVDCWIDQFEEGPSQGFPRWMVQQIARADLVLLVCTDAYRRRFDGVEELGKGLGANFEGYLILQELHDAAMRNRKFIPVLFPPTTREQIPTALRGAESFSIPASYDVLLRRILRSGGVSPHPLGEPYNERWSF
jgi:hypothetical protein